MQKIKLKAQHYATSKKNDIACKIVVYPVFLIFENVHSKIIHTLQCKFKGQNLTHWHFNFNWNYKLN